MKKEEMREQILAAGYKIFSEVGYEKASLRKIAKEAGTTIGNYYNYFENKEALFDRLVKEAYEQFSYFIVHHGDAGGEQAENYEELDMAELWKDGLTEFIGSIIPVFTPNFLLLMDRSQGTKYADFKTSIVDFFEEHYLEHVQTHGDQQGSGDQSESPDQYGRILSEMFVDGLIRVIRAYMGQEIMGEKIAKHFMFFAVGTMEMLKYEAMNR